MINRFYLIVSDVTALEQLVPLGVKLVQLRIKDQPQNMIREQLIRARAVCAKYNAQLIVNDHWQLAVDTKCDFVHLGQEDMDNADFAALRKAGTKIGLSTHDEDELDRALSHNPDYIALGPIYETQLKAMKWDPQGLERISLWKCLAGETPLVAIGGLTPERLPAVFEAGADSAAVVTDIQCASDPIGRTQEWISACQI